MKLYFKRGGLVYIKLLHIKYFAVYLYKKEISNEYNGLYNSEWRLYFIR